MLSAVPLFFAAAFVSAQTTGFDSSSLKVSKDLTNSKAAPAVSVAVASGKEVTRAKATAEWTVMVFINGKNNLERFALSDLNEMEMVGSTDKVNIVVEVGRMPGYDSSDGDWRGVRRYLVKKDTNMYKVTSPVVQDLGMIDMGNPNAAIDFGKWAKKNYPAKKYMFIFWNHGSGWLKSMGAGDTSRGISYDEVSGNHITTPQMAQILKGIGGVNVVGSDACLMQMVEVDYEIKDNVNYIVASEETEPGDGYTYNTFLAPLIAKPTMQGAELAKLAVNAYSDHYEAQHAEYTQSYVRSSSLNQLLKLTNEFAYAVTQAKDVAAAKYARDNAVKYAYRENKDLYSFVSLLVSKSKNANVKAKGQALMNHIKKNVVGHNRTSSYDVFNESNGIAIYLPSRPVDSTYKELQWAKYSNWDEFVAWLAAAK